MACTKVALLVICCAFIAGCSIPSAAIRPFRPPPKPYDSELADSFYRTELKESTSADVLTTIQTSGGELLGQSESVIASWGQAKQTSRQWLNMVAFGEEDTAAMRKYFFIVDEQPQRLYGQKRKLQFDGEIVFDQAALAEPYADEKARRIDLLKKVSEHFQTDISEIRAESAIVNTASLMTNQLFETIQLALETSPAMAVKLNELGGMEFDHMNLGPSRVRMLVVGDIVKVKIKAGPVVKKFDNQADVWAMNLTEELITELANRKAKKVTFLKARSIIYDHDNKRWLNRLDYVRSVDPAGARQLNFLSEQPYQAVLYRPNSLALDEATNLWVFVDTKRAYVLTYYVEKALEN